MPVNTIREGAAAPQCVCHILPPYMLEAIAERGAPEQRERAQATLRLDSALRAGRISQLRVAAPDRAVEGVTPHKQRTIYDAKNATTLPGTQVRAEGQAPTGDVAVTEAYDGLGATFDLYWNVYTRNSIDDAGMGLLGTVHYDRDYDNAFWNGSQMVFGDGDGRLFNRFTISIDVMGHELTHGVTGHEANLTYYGQSGALNESVSDVFGSLVKQYSLGQTADQADWLIGAGLLAAGVHGVALRSMKAPGTAYDDPVLGKDPQPGNMSGYVDTTSDNGGVHTNSGIPNHAFYLLAIALGGHAWEKAGHIWYATLCDARLHADADFQAFAELTVTVAQETFGAAERQAVVQAWAGVGITIGGAPAAWSGWASEGGVLTSGIAVGRNADGRLEVFVRGTDSAMWHNWQVAPNGTWSGWASEGGILTSEIAVGQNADGRLEAFVVGTDRALWHNWQTAPNGTWSGWASEGGVLTSNIAVGQNADGRLEVFVVGTDRALWHKWQTAPNGTWSGWASEGGVLTSDVAVGRNADGRLEVFVVGTDSALWHNWQVAPNGTWSGWASEGGILTSRIAVGSNADGRLEVFVRGTDSAMWHNWQTAPNGTWSGWASEGGVIVSDVGVGRNSSGRLEVFVVGTDSAMWHDWQVAPNGTWSGWASEGGVLVSDVTVGQDADGRLEVFVVGTDSALWHDWQTAPMLRAAVPAEPRVGAAGMPEGLMDQPPELTGGEAADGQRRMPVGRMDESAELGVPVGADGRVAMPRAMGRGTTAEAVGVAQDAMPGVPAQDRAERSPRSPSPAGT
jgi:hypothetical protein